MAFIYTPTGTKIVTGDLPSIIYATKKWPTCHGWVVPYRNREPLNYEAMPYLFGRLADGDAYSALHLSIDRDHQIGILIGTRERPPQRRRRWILREWRNGRSEDITSFRNVPKRYMGIFKVLEDSITQ